jgi:hypothetical protein
MLTGIMGSKNNQFNVSMTNGRWKIKSINQSINNPTSKTLDQRVIVVSTELHSNNKPIICQPELVE